MFKFTLYCLIQDQQILSFKNLDLKSFGPFDDQKNSESVQQTIDKQLFQELCGQNDKLVNNAFGKTGGETELDDLFGNIINENDFFDKEEDIKEKILGLKENNLDKFINNVLDIHNIKSKGKNRKIILSDPNKFKQNLTEYFEGNNNTEDLKQIIKFGCGQSQIYQAFNESNALKEQCYEFKENSNAIKKQFIKKSNQKDNDGLCLTPDSDDKTNPPAAASNDQPQSTPTQSNNQPTASLPLTNKNTPEYCILVKDCFCHVTKGYKNRVITEQFRYNKLKRCIKHKCHKVPGCRNNMPEIHPKFYYWQNNTTEELKAERKITIQDLKNLYVPEGQEFCLESGDFDICDSS